jgi:hypothetical protein
VVPVQKLYSDSAAEVQAAAPRKKEESSSLLLTIAGAVSLVTLLGFVATRLTQSRRRTVAAYASGEAYAALAVSDTTYSDLERETHALE